MTGLAGSVTHPFSPARDSHVKNRVITLCGSGPAIYGTPGLEVYGSLGPSVLTGAWEVKSGEKEWVCFGDSHTSPMSSGPKRPARKCQLHHQRKLEELHRIIKSVIIYICFR